MFNYKKGEYDLNIPKIIFHSILAIFLLSFVFGSFGTISAGERGVKTQLGAIKGIVPQGLYFKLPFVQQVTKMDVKTRTINYDKAGDNGDEKLTVASIIATWFEENPVPSEYATAEPQGDNLFGASKDLQDVAIGIVVNYHINPENVTNIYAQYSSVENYQTNVIEPIVREIVKSTSAQYTAEELVTKRAEYSDKVNTNLAQRLTTKSAILERFSVTNFSFSKAFSNAIESKVTAVQNAEAQKNKLEQVKYEAQQQIEKAKAEAESIRIQASAINSQGGADYVQLQAIAKWNGQLPVQMIPNSTVPFVNLKN